MTKKAEFIFNGELQDFTNGKERITYEFTGKPNLKDAIEAIGPPHPEIGSVIWDIQPVSLNEYLIDQAQILVEPRVYTSDEFEKAPRFILDVHLGSLARQLRLFGFDTHYRNDIDDPEIATIADKEHRIVLTRDLGLLKNNLVDKGRWMRSQRIQEQFEEVLDYFQIKNFIKPFTRCMKCNGEIDRVNKEAIVDKIPPGVKKDFDQFYQCENCKQVYWKGSHYQRMEETIKKYS